MIKVTILGGRIGADPELRYTSGGKAVCTVRVGADVGWGDKKKTLWYECTLWDKRAESLQPHLKKGMQVSIVGDAQEPRTWEGQNGQTRVSMGINVDEISFQSQATGGNGASNRSRPEPPPRQQDFDDDDDIPF